MKDKNKNKAFKATPLTFEEKMEKMMQDQKAQIDSLSNIIQMQFDMIKNLQEGSNAACSNWSNFESKFKSQKKQSLEMSESISDPKRNSFMLGKFLKSGLAYYILSFLKWSLIDENKNEDQHNLNPLFGRMKTEKQLKPDRSHKIKSYHSRKKFSVYETIK